MRAIYQRFRGLIHEVAKFGVIGGLAFIVDIGIFDYFTHEGLGASRSKIISTIISASLAYVGNRVWSFKHRESLDVRKEYVTFVVINGITLVFALVILQIAGSGFGVKAGLLLNLINVGTIAVGTVFRFWAYRRFVFLAPGGDAEAVTAHHGAEELGDPAARAAADTVAEQHAKHPLAAEPAA